MGMAIRERRTEEGLLVFRLEDACRGDNGFIGRKRANLGEFLTKIRTYGGERL
jgi:hypothetical protein